MVANKSKRHCGLYLPINHLFKLAKKKKSYTAIVKIWLNPDGTVSRFDLAKGSNDPDIDKLLEKLLGKFKKAGEAPPPGMEQPIKFKISSRL